MSGTQDDFSAEDKQNTPQPSQVELESNKQTQTKEVEKELSPSQKMDNLLRNNSTGLLKKEIEKLRKEAAKYRISSKNATEEKEVFKQKTEEITKELNALKAKHKELEIIRILDNAGCLKSELVAKEIPNDCEYIKDFVDNYKEKNKFLFKQQKENIGSSFKTSSTKNLTPTQQMDAYIRSALGR